MSSHAGREKWESAEDLLHAPDPTTTEAMEAARLDAERAAQAHDRHQREMEKKRGEQKARHAAPCRRCRTSDTPKSHWVGKHDVCENCAPIVELVEEIERCGGMAQSTDDLAANLHRAGVRLGDNVW